MTITLTYEDLVELQEISSELPEDEKDVALQIIELAKIGYEKTMEDLDREKDIKSFELLNQSQPPEDIF